MKQKDSKENGINWKRNIINSESIRWRVLKSFKKDEEALKLRKEYQEKFNKIPPGINYDEYSSMEEYKEYLRAEINKDKQN